MKKKYSFYKILSLLIITLISIILLRGLFFKPYISGDGHEYLAMTQAFENHLSPEINQQDVIDCNNSYEEFYIKEVTSFRGLFKDNEGNYYSYHFWLYSLFVLPFKLILKSLGLLQLRAFYLFNAAFFLFTILYSYFKLNTDEKKKFFWIALIAINPILFYIAWTHAEVFIYCFTCLSLVCFFNKKYAKAIFLVSIASTQNQPIIFLGGLYYLVFFFNYFKTTNNKLIITKPKIISIIKPAVINACCFIPFLFSPIFYYMHFGKFSLIVKPDFFKEITNIIPLLSKIQSLFFDLNFGMILFIPMVIIFFIIIIIKNTIKKPFNSVLYIVILFAICLFCAFQRNWNPGISGINRYSVWITPILIYYICFEFEDFKNILLNKIYTYGIFTSIIITFFIITGNGMFKTKLDYREFTPISKIVLVNFPQLYNPQYEIFYERYNGFESSLSHEIPLIVNKDNTYIKKIFLNNSHINYIKGLITEDSNKILDKKVKKNKKNWYYINFPLDNVKVNDYYKNCLIQEEQIYKQGKNFKLKNEDMIFEIENTQFPDIISHGENLKVSFNFINISKSVFPRSSKSINSIYLHCYILKGDSLENCDLNESQVLKRSLYPGEKTNFNFNMKTNTLEKGNYKLVFFATQENAGIFNNSELKYVYDFKIE